MIRLLLNSLFTSFMMIFLACAKNEKIEKIVFFQMAKEVDPEIEMIIPKEISGGIDCKNYGPGCLSGFQASVKGLDFIYLEFNSENEAKAEAKRIKGMYRGNWAFDDIQNEPVLERFLKQAYQAEYP